MANQRNNKGSSVVGITGLILAGFIGMYENNKAKNDIYKNRKKMYEITGNDYWIKDKNNKSEDFLEKIENNMTNSDTVALVWTLIIATFVICFCVIACFGFECGAALLFFGIAGMFIIPLLMVLSGLNDNKVKNKDMEPSDSWALFIGVIITLSYLIVAFVPGLGLIMFYGAISMEAIRYLFAFISKIIKMY